MVPIIWDATEQHLRKSFVRRRRIVNWAVFVIVVLILASFLCALLIGLFSQ